ncbi:MBL fold metallo-hydrolase [Arthrobacter sp. I2-34]|uniref:MBL fold metallo-hydrolase n=1 Tax=Arthrobacter hankyongi TaxID=2904801 RepID=A0ABS9LB32_9MICC|nr:MBL fold metallo-hydrolase [Arthrobacter hankyongi]MCG2623903.1 MBL fold metallo-hydrolase [Arthrobacter hankyongi]
MGVRIENLVTSGTFSLDGGTWDVNNNVWIVGDDDECVIIDSPHDAAAIIGQVRGRKVLAILLTHAHNDHIGAAREVAKAVEAPIYLNPEDLVLWEQVYPDAGPDRHHADGDEFQVGGATLRAIHTPGHSPGSTCFYLEGEDTVFTGDTLFNGGHGDNTTIGAEQETLANISQ